MATPKKPSIDVTIAIPTYDGEEHLEKLLSSVFDQSTVLNYNVLIIDSGSSDQTLEIISKFSKVKLHKIPNSEFGHGKTRNLAVSMSNATYVVFLSQDAIPATPKWLDSIIEPFKINDNIFCVFGKQSPRKFTDATTKREVYSVFKSLGPDHSIMLHRGKSLIDSQDLVQKLTFFSDVNSAVKTKFLLEKIPYRDVRYSEDQLLGKDILDSGYLKAYAPSAEVIHSNDYPIKKYFARRIDEYSAMYEYLGVTPEGRIISLVKLFVMETLRDYVFIIRDTDYLFRQKLKNFFESPIRIFEKLRASYFVNKNKEKLYLMDKHSLEKIIKK